MCYGDAMNDYGPYEEVRYVTFKPLDYIGYIANPSEIIELETKTVPKCTCHGINMRRYTDRSQPHGFAFRCPIKRRLSQNRYNKKRLESDQIYRTTDVIRLRKKRRVTAIENGERQLKSMRGDT